jgi:hypothetical protein
MADPRFVDPDTGRSLPRRQRAAFWGGATCHVCGEEIVAPIEGDGDLVDQDADQQWVHSDCV